MLTLFKIVSESVSQALQQLTANKLRSFLSLLGIAIGIFCIIGVTAAVDSLEDNVRGSFDKLGEDVVYVQKFMWGDPGPNWRKYLRRPNMLYDDYEVLASKVASAQMTTYSVGVGSKTIKYRSSSVDGVELQGVTYDFAEMFSFQYAMGRYFSPVEYHSGANRIILGYKVAEELFGSVDPIGKHVKVGGNKLMVVGVLEEEGENLVNIFNFDNSAVITYELARKIANLKPNNPFGNSSVQLKAGENVSIQELKDDITWVMRNHRRLKPKEEDNFSLNTLSIISNLLTGFFGVLNSLGYIIGGFAIFVGVFSVANIMFVSVKERTNLIGVKKALGAKRYMILLEFLIEAIILCLIGGLFGLAIVFVIVKILSGAIEFELFLSAGNILFGIGLSIFVGIVSGVIPAMQASGLDPVVAMRQ
jgi:putative ABC transport system permease protein